MLVIKCQLSLRTQRAHCVVPQESSHSGQVTRVPSDVFVKSGMT